MKNLFLSVLNLSITASYVILAILIVRFLLRRAPRKYSYMLWAIAAVRLICPFSFTAPLSVLSYAPAVSRSTQGMPVTQMVYFEPAPSIDVEFEDLQPTTVRPLVSASQDYMRMIAFIWIAVVAGMMLYGVYAYIKVGRSVKTAIPQEDNVYVCTNISSPFVFGIVRPRIYLTKGLSDEEKEVIIAHERYHIKRCDHLIKILAYILTCIYWFHPLVWLSFYLMQRDMEMSCDEHVLMSHDKISRRYSSLLLGFAEGKPSFYAPLSFGENDISSRIKNILHFRKPHRLTTILCIVLMVITCAACLTNPSSAKFRYCRNLIDEHRNYTAHVTITENNTIVQKLNFLTDTDNCGEVNMFIFNGIDSDRVILYNSKDAVSYGRDIYDGYLFEGSWDGGLEIKMIPRFDQNMIDAAEYIMSNVKTSKWGNEASVVNYSAELNGNQISKVMEYLGKDTGYAELNPAEISFSLSIEEQKVAQIKYTLTAEDKIINMETFFNQYDNTFTGLGCQFLH